MKRYGQGGRGRDARWDMLGLDRLACGMSSTLDACAVRCARAGHKLCRLVQLRAAGQAADALYAAMARWTPRRACRRRGILQHVPACAAALAARARNVTLLVEGAGADSQRRLEQPRNGRFPGAASAGFRGRHGSPLRGSRDAVDLSQLVTGETPPYTSLMYVWDNKAPVGSVIASGRANASERSSSTRIRRMPMRGDFTSVQSLPTTGAPTVRSLVR